MRLYFWLLQNLSSNKWGKNIEYRKSSATETPTLKKDPSRMNQQELQELLTRISNVKPSAKGTAVETGKVVGTGGLLAGAYTARPRDEE